MNAATNAPVSRAVFFAAAGVVGVVQMLGMDLVAQPLFLGIFALGLVSAGALVKSLRHHEAAAEKNQSCDSVVVRQPRWKRPRHILAGRLREPSHTKKQDRKASIL